MSTLCFLLFSDKNFHLDVHYVCYTMLIQRKFLLLLFQEGSKEGRKEERKKGMKEEWTEGRKEGRKLFV